jgi:hypothetical protein
VEQDAYMLQKMVFLRKSLNSNVENCVSEKANAMYA